MNNSSLKNKKKKIDLKLEARYGYLLVAPLMTLIVVFTFFPAVYSFAISLFHYNPFGHIVFFVGLANYDTVLHSGLFAKAILDVLYYTVVVVSIQTILAFMFAILFNHKMMVSRISRAFVFIPAIVSSVALSIIFIWVFSDQGLINYFTSFFGVKPINFFFSTTAATNTLLKYHNGNEPKLTTDLKFATRFPTLVKLKGLRSGGKCANILLLNIFRNIQ